MEIHAYNQNYLNGAMTAMATMLDYAVNFYNEHIDYFFKKFIDMGFALQFERGNPDVLVGRSGVELYSMIAGRYTDLKPYFAPYRSAEYWVGWSLAYYQWYSGRTFREITEVVKPSEMLDWYPTLHEADLMRFAEVVDERLKGRMTNLEILRRNAGLSQTQLSELSGVTARTIRAYEQRQSDISKAQFNILNALSMTLGCSVYDLMDSNVVPYYASQGNTLSAFSAQMMQSMQNSVYALEHGGHSTVRANALRYGYLSQFPYQAVTERAGTAAINQNTFQDNWSRYWEGVIQQQEYAEAERQRRRQMVESLAKEALGMAIRASGNRQASMLYDGLCAVTAPNVIEAAAKAASVVMAATENNR